MHIFLVILIDALQICVFKHILCLQYLQYFFNLNVLFFMHSFNLNIVFYRIFVVHLYSHYLIS